MSPPEAVSLIHFFISTMINRTPEESGGAERPPLRQLLLAPELLLVLSRSSRPPQEGTIHERPFENEGSHSYGTIFLRDEGILKLFVPQVGVCGTKLSGHRLDSMATDGTMKVSISQPCEHSGRGRWTFHVAARGGVLSLLFH